MGWFMEPGCFPRSKASNPEVLNIKVFSNIESGGVKYSKYYLENLDQVLEGSLSTLPPLPASSVGWIRTGDRSEIVLGYV